MVCSAGHRGFGAAGQVYGASAAVAVETERMQIRFIHTPLARACPGAVFYDLQRAHESGCGSLQSGTDGMYTYYLVTGMLYTAHGPSVGNESGGVYSNEIERTSFKSFYGVWLRAEECRVDNINVNTNDFALIIIRNASPNIDWSVIVNR
ncbi:hypothetical protein QTP88_015853 [Uroleucon formosanum]